MGAYGLSVDGSWSSATIATPPYGLPIRAAIVVVDGTVVVVVVVVVVPSVVVVAAGSGVEAQAAATSVAAISAAPSRMLGDPCIALSVPDGQRDSGTIVTHVKPLTPSVGRGDRYRISTTPERRADGSTAEGEGFEPSEACASLVFKTSTFVRSATPPRPGFAERSRLSTTPEREAFRSNAEGVGFEPTGPESGPTVFETVTFVRSVTPPGRLRRRSRYSVLGTWYVASAV